MSAFDALITRAQNSPARVVLPEATDSRVLEAALQAQGDGRCHPVLVGEKKSIYRAAKEFALPVDELQTIDILNIKQRQELAEILFEKRKHKGMTIEGAQSALADPLTYACTLVHAGQADACVAGAGYATADVTRAALQIVGAAKNASFVSSFFLMTMKHQFQALSGITVFADCALVIEPDATELSEIAVQTARSTAALLGTTPVVAMLSFSTDGSAKHPRVIKVQEATALTNDIFTKENPQWKVVGDVQLDAAVVPEILQKKAPDFAAKLGTDALPNILVFPNLEAGNIGYKLCERFGDCDAIGPVLQGLARPVNDLSRGCKTEDISRILAITSLQAMA